MIYDIKKDNYESALFKQKFVVPTKIAVMRFLYGYTRYVGPSLGGSSDLESTGWKVVFENKNTATVKEYLVSPKSKNVNLKFDLSDELWV